MNWTAALLLATCLQVSAAGYSQGRITLSLKKAPLQRVFAAIETQSGYTVWYDMAILKNTTPINIDVKDISLEQALTIACKNQPLEFSITDKMFVITAKTNKAENDPPQKIDVKGRVINENGEPVPGVTISVKGGFMGSMTDMLGAFEIAGIDADATLILSSVNVQTQEINLGGRKELILVVKAKVSRLDEVQIIAYGTTTTRKTTGSYSKITSEEIESQPVSNPLAAMEGRAPGIVITQANGLPGSPFSVTIRGQNSIGSGNQPLFLVDGVPFTNNSLSLLASANQSQSPFNSINPSDIEGIEVLKDADATAIYGSQGANGVILITTKKGKSGKSSIKFNAYTGIGSITRSMDFMDNKEYLAMRREAFQNDGVLPDATNAPDLYQWDTTSYRDWKKILIGGTAKTSDLQGTISGGNENTQFLMGVNYHFQTTVYPGSLSDNRLGAHFNTTHHSQNGKFNSSLTASFSFDDNKLIQSDLTQYINTAPDAPSPYDATGKLNWSEAGANFDNPLAILNRPNIGKTQNLISEWNVSYELSKGLTFKSNFGYTFIQHKESQITPLNSLNPLYGFTSGFASFGNNSVNTWIVEPQAEYHLNFKKSQIGVLAGATWQQELNDGTSIYSSNFSSDALINDPGSAGSNFILTNYSQYRYQAIFGRIHYDYDNKYLLNITGRRDGSSRFGSANRLANFGAVGGGWIFRESGSSPVNLKFLSFGKVRASYGISGNDQIGDYQFLDSWQTTIYPYQGQSGLLPARLNNPNYEWEINRKAELGFDFGLFNEKLLLTFDYYLNRSGNQLLNYNLPIQTGFGSIIENLPAKIENSGIELSVNSVNIKSKTFTWSTTFNLTIATNKLISFPGLESSSYANQFEIGHPLNILKLLNFEGVDPKTGIYSFTGTSIPEDLTGIGNISPKYYGGLGNDFIYKNLSLNLFFQFICQNGQTYIKSNVMPGLAYNEPEIVTDRWLKPQDITTNQLYSAGYSSAALTSYTNYRMSTAIMGDASFIRLKTLKVSYALPKKWFKGGLSNGVAVFAQGQNLFTITRYRGADPETQNFLALPPLRELSAGIRCAF